MKDNKDAFDTESGTVVNSFQNCIFKDERQQSLGELLKSFSCE